MKPQVRSTAPSAPHLRDLPVIVQDAAVRGGIKVPGGVEWPNLAGTGGPISGVYQHNQTDLEF